MIPRPHIGPAPGPALEGPAAVMVAAGAADTGKETREAERAPRLPQRLAVGRRGRPGAAPLNTHHMEG